jgi:Flp pilus assembly secretin CpaC
MAASFALRKPARGLFAAIAIAAAALPDLQPALAAGTTTTDVIVVRLDQARITRLPDKVSTIVVGNPLIADVSLQAGGLLVLTGKGYGVTNLVALDRAGTVLSEFLIQVEAATDTIVVVYRGAARESYSCTPECAPRISLGDTQPYFDSAIGQTVIRNGRAQTGGAPAGGGAAAR